jgi:nonsense-mediated mRNA decay protein 3
MECISLKRVDELEIPMFCVECGKEEIYKNGICLNCYVQNTHFTFGPEIIDIIACSVCEGYKHKNNWFDESLEQAIRRHIKEVFTFSHELNEIKIDLMYDDTKKIIECTVEITGVINDKKILEKHTVVIRIKKTVCDVCSKQSGGYYEAVLQIRAENRTPSKKELALINQTVEAVITEHQSKGNRTLFIADTAKERGGIDYYISEKGSAYTIAKKIQEKYGGIIKQSSTNIGMKDSRQIYRMTYLIRLPSYQVGNFIEYNNSFYFITSISSVKVHVLELNSWSEQVVDGKNLQKVRVIGSFDRIKEMILVSQSTDEVQLMDPKNYKIFDIKKPMNVTFHKKSVSTALLDDYVYLLPEKIKIDK